MEATRIANKHKAGSAMDALLRPVVGVREEQARRGIKPKDFARENMRTIRDKQQQNREQQQQDETKQPFVMSRFKNIPSAVFTQKPHTAHATTNHAFLSKGQGRQSVTATAPRRDIATTGATATRARSVSKPPVPRAAELARHIPDTSSKANVDFISANARKVIARGGVCGATRSASVPRVSSFNRKTTAGNAPSSGEVTPSPYGAYGGDTGVHTPSNPTSPPSRPGFAATGQRMNAGGQQAQAQGGAGGGGLHREFGKVPKYIKEFRQNAELAKQKAAEEAEAKKVPAGYRVMGEEERQQTLDTLRAKRTETEKEYQKLPLRIETVGQRKRQETLQQKIADIDDAIKVFSKKTVLVEIGA